jgi:hypothetical protein
MARTKQAETQKVNSYDAELAKFAQQYGSMEERSGGNLPMLSLKSGKLTYNGGEVPDSRLNVIVLDSIFENLYYEEPYDVDNPVSPSCFAFGNDDRIMAPHENSSAMQCESKCIDCAFNKFGSAEKGKGKACKNTRRLACITEEDLENIEDATVFYVKIPPTSTKFWAGYVQQITKVMKVPPFAVVTELQNQTDPKTQIRVTFKLVEQVTDKAKIKQLIAKRESITEELRTPYQPATFTEEPAKPASRSRGKAREERDSNPPGRPGRESTGPVPRRATAKPKPESEPEPTKGRGGRRF